MKKNIFLIAISLFCSLSLFSQQTIIKADTVIANPGDSVNVSIYASDFNNIGSFTLFIDFNTGSLQWGQALNWNPQLVSGNPLVNAVNGTLIIAWADVNGATISSDKLVDIQFYFMGGESELVFTTSCEVTDVIGNLVSPDPIYFNGRVSQPLNVIIDASQTTICSGDTVQLNAIASYGTGNYSYLWALSPVGFVSTISNPIVNPTTTTTYFLTVSDGIDSASDSVLISISNVPAPIFSTFNMLPADSSENMVGPILFSWSPALYADKYDFYIWVDSLPRPITPFASNLTQIYYNYTPSLNFGTSYKWQVVARNNCFYTEGPVNLFTTRFLPDLHISQISTSQAFAGQPLTVSWTVTNNGPGATVEPIWHDRIWICPDVEVRIGEPEDIMLGMFDNLTYLPAGQSYTNTKQVMLPKGIEGSYFIFVITDAADALFMDWTLAGGTPPIPYTPNISGSPYPYIFAWSHSGSYYVKELSSNGNWDDNFFYVQIDVVMPPEPDLIVTSIIPPSNVFSGQQKNISWTVKNNGTVTAAGSWSDALYLSKDSILPDITQATLLGTFNYNGYLEADSSYTKVEAVTFPSFEYGDYYVHVITDASDLIYEGLFEDNNSKVSSMMTIFLTPPPDLFVTSINIPDTADNKMDIMVEWSVKNQGATSTLAGSWYDNIYISDSSAFDSTLAISIGGKYHSGNLEPDSSYLTQMMVQIPEEITGICYIYIYTDIDNNVFEHSQETNNIVRSDTSILIQSPDLFISSIQIPVKESTNQPVNINYSIKNNGPGNLLLSAFENKVYLSHYEAFVQDSVIEIGVVNSLSSLLDGDSINITQSVAIPIHLHGTYYVFIQTDFNNSVYEGSNEDNNISRSNSTIDIIRADLAVTLIEFDPQAQSGNSSTIRWTVINNGPGAIVNSFWNDMVMLSKSPIYQADSVIVLGIIDIDTTVIPGDGYVKNHSFVFPEILSGNYYIYVYTDVYDTIFENQIEANNILRSTTTIEITNPDLIVSEINIPLSANSGTEINISWIDMNIGNGNVNYRYWQDQIMISPLPVYYADSIIVLGTNENINTIPTGDSLIINKDITIPHGISGNYYFFVHTDIGDTVYEGGMDNNNMLIDINPISISLSPWIDLIVKEIILTDTSVAGSQINLQYSVKNQGYAGTSGAVWKDKIYLSRMPLLDTNAIFLQEFVRNTELLPDSSYEENILITLPADLSSDNYYVYVFTDADSALYEYVYKDNNVLRSSQIYISHYPIDLAAQNLIATDTAWSGDLINIEWSVKNISQVPTISSLWYDAVYLSTDTVFDASTDIMVAQWEIFGPLESDSIYIKTKSCNLPNGISGFYYMLMVNDHTDINNDTDPANNIVLKSHNNSAFPIYINLTPSPDLIVESLSAPLECTSGQPFDVIFSIRNIGVGPTTKGSWTDKIYLSTDFVIDNNDDVIGTYQRTSDLDTNEVYIDTLEVTVPVLFAGNFILIYNTDDNDQVYEHNGENNNTNMAFILAIQPPPTDLIVKDIIVPDSGIVGKPMDIQWTIKNNGQNPAKGKMRDIIYLSSDTILDIDDAILAQYDDYVNLIPLSEKIKNTTTTIPGVALGGYFVIIKTDVKNNIFESNDDNNTSFSNDSVYLDVNKLPFDVLTHDTLFNARDLNYRVEVPDTLQGETMLTTLRADSINGINEMYLSYNKASSRINYEFSHAFPYQGNQELVVPALLEGNYYMLLFGSTFVGNSQSISLLATILNFEIRSIKASTASNRGKVTVELNGSKFVPLMEVWLENTTDTIYPDTIIYVDRSKVFITFELYEEAIGLYDVIAHNFCVGTTSLQNGFEIIDGDKGKLGIDIVTPATARPKRVTSFTVEYANIGHTDITNPTIIVDSHTGAPIAIEADDLGLELTQIVIPLQIPGEPNNILRPGVTGSIVIYTYTSAGIGITIGSPNF
ncbi:MAG: hypothetical protein K8S00_11040 [Bacteroidales bacterium]|nr:hypothetical protein [Bacteroidales bacterium]